MARLRMGRVVVASVALAGLLAGSLAWAAESMPVPRGKRTKRPVATHVVVSDVALETGGGPASLRPGVPVAVAGKLSGKGKTRVTVLQQGIEVSGLLDGASLGMCVQEEVPALAVDGKKIVGKVHAGALVRVVPGSAKAGHELVETAGAFGVRLHVPKSSLAPKPTEVVLAFDWNYQTAKTTVLYEGQSLAGNGFVRLPEGVRVEAYEQAGDVLHVRTLGAVELDGWTPAANLAAREGKGPSPSEPALIKPSHEVFLDVPLLADSKGKRRIGVLRGGTLVEVNSRASAADDDAVKLGMVKVVTPNPAVVEGWLRLGDLRRLPGDAKLLESGRGVSNE